MNSTENPHWVAFAGTTSTQQNAHGRLQQLIWRPTERVEKYHRFSNLWWRTRDAIRHPVKLQAVPLQHTGCRHQPCRESGRSTREATVHIPVNESRLSSLSPVWSVESHDLRLVPRQMNPSKVFLECPSPCFLWTTCSSGWCPSHCGLGIPMIGKT